MASARTSSSARTATGYCCGVPLAAYAVVTHDVVSGGVARATRLVIGAMLLVTFAFPLAACCSQL